MSPVERAMREALVREPLVLAVSGGRDSMAMLAAAIRAAPDRIAAVATFDHGTGPVAARAADLVARHARNAGISTRVGRGSGGHREAEWRAERWDFLRAVSIEIGARVATAHTLDDQLETVVLRVLRGSGPRGLAALHAGDVARPLLELSREDLARYASDTGITWIDDPSNDDPTHARNRARHDLLPALISASPAIASDLLAISDRAATLRAEVDRFVRDELSITRAANGAVQVSALQLDQFDAPALGILWPAIAAMAGVILDRRGTDRLIEFTNTSRADSRIPLSGGAEVVRRRDSFVVRPPSTVLAGSNSWRLRLVRKDEVLGESLWAAHLPRDAGVQVRSWRPADRIWSPSLGAARRVKRFLKDARVPADERVTWPVVLVNDEIVWVPGVCRSDAATVRSGRPAARYVCERYDIQSALVDA